MDDALTESISPSTSEGEAMLGLERERERPRGKEHLPEGVVKL